MWHFFFDLGLVRVLQMKVLGRELFCRCTWRAPHQKAFCNRGYRRVLAHQGRFLRLFLNLCTTAVFRYFFQAISSVFSLSAPLSKCLINCQASPSWESFVWPSGLYLSRWRCWLLPGGWCRMHQSGHLWRLLFDPFRKTHISKPYTASNVIYSSSAMDSC